MINIMFCSNDKYAPKLLAALGSLLDSNKGISDKLNVIIRTNDMKQNTILKLQKIVEKYGNKTTSLVIKYTDDLCDKLEREKVKKFKDSYLCYFKLFGLDTLLENDQERLLVIDCDTLIFDSIQDLYDFDLKGKVVGAVREFPATHTLNIIEGYGEYNTGVLLWDMKKYKDMNIEKKLKETINLIPEDRWKTGDQTVFTICMEQLGMVERLPLKYNFIINQRYFSYREFMFIRDIKSGYYSEDEYEMARRQPCIMHLISGDFVISPWYYEGNREIKKVWDQYLRQIDWEEEVKIGLYSHLPLKAIFRSMIFRLLHGCLPRELSMRIFKMMYQFGCK